MIPNISSAFKRSISLVHKQLFTIQNTLLHPPHTITTLLHSNIITCTAWYINELIENLIFDATKSFEILVRNLPLEDMNIVLDPISVVGFRNGGGAPL